MDSHDRLSLRLTPADTVCLRTTVGDATHELSLERDEFEQLFHHLLRIRAKLDLRDARGVIEGPERFGWR